MQPRNKKRLNLIFSLVSLWASARELRYQTESKLCFPAYQCRLCAGVVFCPDPRMYLGSCAERPVTFLKLSLTSILYSHIKARAI